MTDDYQVCLRFYAKIPDDAFYSFVHDETFILFANGLQ